MGPKKSSGSPLDSSPSVGESKDSEAQASATNSQEVEVDPMSDLYRMVFDLEAKMTGVAQTSLTLQETIRRETYDTQQRVTEQLLEMQKSTFNSISSALREITQAVARLNTDVAEMKSKEGFSPRKSPKKDKPISDERFWFDAVQQPAPEEQEVNFDELDFDSDLVSSPKRNRKPARMSLVDSREVIQKKKLENSSVQYYEPAPKPTFKLLSTKYSEVFAFVLAYRMHILKYPTAPIQLQLIIDQRVQTQIMSRCRIMFEDEFYAMSNSDVLKSIQKTIRPKHRKRFIQVLLVSVRFDSNADFQLDVLNFVRFYDRLITYVRDFVYVFTFLCESVPEENREEVIPPIIKKEGGLIKIFWTRFLANTVKRCGKVSMDT